jgi:GrpB-like predicted nucleotidyltransferase (UPF0157 family)
VEKNDVQWQNYIIFRDCLRRDANVRKEYAKLKKNLALKYPKDRDSYTRGKEQFIRIVLVKLNG